MEASSLLLPIALQYTITGYMQMETTANIVIPRIVMMVWVVAVAVEQFY